MKTVLGGLLLATGVLAACGNSGPAAPTAAAITPPAPAPTPTPLPAATPTPPPTIVRVADLVSVNGHVTRGTARLVSTPPGHRLELSDDFATNGSQTVDIYLTRRPDMPRPGDLNAGLLTSRRGAHSFDLGTAELSHYAYVIVWCRPFRISIGLGALFPPS